MRTDGLLVIRDLATTNGTKVKGQRVRWAAFCPKTGSAWGIQDPRLSRFGRDAGAIGAAAAIERVRAAPPAALHRPAPVKAAGNAPTVRCRRRTRAYPRWNGRDSAAAAAKDEPEFLDGGFEIIDDDEDEIIDLE